MFLQLFLKVKGMAEKEKMWIALLFISFSWHSLCSGAKLSEPKILLPYYSTFPTSYQIEIHEARGCFTW